jgi:hypothetical protein
VSDDGVDLRVYVQNVGETTMQLEEEGCLYVDGILVPCSIDGATVSDDMATLGQGETATLRYSLGAPPQGEKVTVKVVTVHGTCTEEVYQDKSTGRKPVWIMWDRTYGGTGADQGCSVVETSDKGYAIAGYTASNVSTVNEYSDFLLVKTDVFGNLKWNRTYGGGGSEQAYSLVETSDGGYVLSGFTTSFGSGGDDFWLVKTDAEGIMEWSNTYGGIGDDRAMCVVAASDGGYAVVGYTESFGAGSKDFFLVKTDASGNVEWNQTYGGEGQDCAFALVNTADRGYAIAGYTESFGGVARDSWLVKIDKYGTIEWDRTYSAEIDSYEEATALVVTSDGGYAIAGSAYSLASTFGTDCWLVKTDASGEALWNKTYGDENACDYACSLVETSDGGYTIASISDGMDFSRDYRWIKTDNLGNLEWDKRCGTTDSYAPNSVIETFDGGYAIASTKGDWLNQDVWLMKTDEYGNTR